MIAAVLFLYSGMNPENYPPLNVLCVSWFEPKTEAQGRIQPLRIEQESGEVHHVKEVRQHVEIPAGKTVQHQFNVSTKEGDYLEIWLDMHTLTWRLVGGHSKEGEWLNFWQPFDPHKSIHKAI